MNRRFFLLAAPAIVAAPSLMRVSTMPERLSAGDNVIMDIDFSNGRVWMEQSPREMRLWYRPAGLPTWACRTIGPDDDGNFKVTLPHVGDQAILLG